MQLYAVIIPPPEVVRGALEAAGGLCPPAPAAPEEPRPGLLGRLLARRQPEPPPAPVVAVLPAAPEAVFVRLAKFGNVTADDAEGLAAALDAVAGTWPAPVLRVSRVRVAEAHPFDVTAQLDGDVDALRDIYRNVNEVARLQRFFLDRRSFRSELPLGSLDLEDGASLPDGLAGRELPHQGARWSPSHVTLLRTSFTAGKSFAEVARVELAHGVEESGALTGA
ncbi:hypothetical protein EXE59_02390 [Nocardioides eburneiflavus]|uniref:2'-5' RNA ligase family protein n=1 Tax=Nocardioides eburneiflavus TaxID=2518372 RepID=A0A4Z1BNP1_9ACTN|nr:hypothetical protein [Nocardioides eburneiflavus]TGN62921.1 hypothetical protein EXE59_02390 [Nocardioides eburneiflavus]